MMRKLISLLAIMLMACPVAMGATYVDTFDNAAPDLTWGLQDDQGNAELWVGGYGLATPDSSAFSVSYGGTATVIGAALPPDTIMSIMSDNSGNPIPYTGGSVTVAGILNPNGSSNTADRAIAGFMMDTDSSGFPEAYLLMTSPAYHDLALYSISEIGHPNDQVAIRLALVDLGNYSGQTGEPLMDMPLDCTMQIETIDSGPNWSLVRLSGLVYGDYDGVGGTEKLAEMSFTVHVDTPAPHGHDPPGTYVRGDVPLINQGAVGFAGVRQSDAPEPINLGVEDYVSWDSLKGDFDLDGDVDVTDLGILATNYGTTTGATVFLGDSNYNGDVMVSDLGDLATYYNTDVWAAAGAVVPEPTTMTMLVLGAWALLIRRRR